MVVPPGVAPELAGADDVPVPAAPGTVEPVTDATLVEVAAWAALSTFAK